MPVKQTPAKQKKVTHKPKTKTSRLRKSHPAKTAVRLKARKPARKTAAKTLSRTRTSPQVIEIVETELYEESVLGGVEEEE